MKLIIGLGNPGLRYAATRHNIGATVVKALSKKYKARFKFYRSFKSRIATIAIAGQECALVLPQTFMNLSGEAVSLTVRHYRPDVCDIIVVHDDMDVELGRIKFKARGSSGGHNGVSSIIELLVTQEFHRLKIGIGKSSEKSETRDYVLSWFGKEEAKVIAQALTQSVEALEVWAKEGIEAAMNRYNEKK